MGPITSDADFVADASLVFPACTLGSLRLASSLRGSLWLSFQVPSSVPSELGLSPTLLLPCPSCAHPPTHSLLIVILLTLEWKFPENKVFIRSFPCLAPAHETAAGMYLWKGLAQKVPVVMFSVINLQDSDASSRVWPGRRPSRTTGWHAAPRSPQWPSYSLGCLVSKPHAVTNLSQYPGGHEAPPQSQYSHSTLHISVASLIPEPQSPSSQAQGTALPALGSGSKRNECWCPAQCCHSPGAPDPFIPSFFAHLSTMPHTQACSRLM